MHQLHGSHLLCAAGGALLRAAAKAWRTAQTRMITRTPPHRSKRQGRDAAVWRSACGACEAAPGFESIARVLRNSALRHQGEGDIASNAPTAWFSPPLRCWWCTFACCRKSLANCANEDDNTHTSTQVEETRPGRCGVAQRLRGLRGCTRL